MPARPHSTLTFRADLQGLRAIAVIAVLLAHSGVTGFSGGYIGVDLFFILSGFLITGALCEEYEKNAKLNILGFYSRRLKRLLPALVVVIIVTLVAAFILLPTFQAKAQIGSSPFASLWLSNFYFTFTDLDYFAELGQKDLFLHTWSLGVEEQFYLTWPFLVLLLIRLSRQKNHTGFDTGLRMIFGLCMILGASFALNLYWTKEQPLFAFYQMPSRAWQFALGAIVLLAVRRLDIQRDHHANVFAGFVILVVGLVATALCVNLYHEQMAYPGWAAILPSIAAALIILAGHWLPEKQNPLTWRPLVWLGNRSYSLYLWHWPVLLLFEALNGPLSNELTIIAVAVTFLLTEITYRLIERPFWKGSLGSFEPKRIIQTGSLVMLLLLLGTFHAARQPVENNTAKTGDIIQQWRSDYPIIYTMPCDAWYSHDKVQPCVFGPENAEKTVVLLGDSVGAQWFSLVASSYLPLDWRVVVLTKSSCPLVDESYFYTRIKRVYEVCDQWRTKVLDRLVEWQPDVVFVGSASSYGFTDQEWISGSQRVWSKIKTSGAYVVVIPGTPTIGIDAPSCISRHMQSGETELSSVCRSDQTQDAAYRVSSLLKRAAADMPNVEVLDLNSRVCPSGICSAMTNDGVMVFRDSRHLTDSFVSILAQKVGPLLPKSSKASRSGELAK